MAIKIKPLTSELIEEISDKSGYDIKAVRKVFHLYWNDVGIVFNHALGYSTHVDELGTFHLNFRNRAFLKDREHRINKAFKTLVKFRQAAGGSPSIKVDNVNRRLNVLISDVLILEATFKLYEKQVRSQYPKKYKADHQAIQAALERIQKLVGIPLASFKVAIRYPVQEVYVRKLSKFGVLPNRVIKVDKKM